MSIAVYYNSQQVSFIALSIVAIVLSMFFYKKEKFSLSVFFLVVSAFFIRYVSASMDPFLHMWDEQFHALVAKNLSEDMLKPILYKHHYFGYDYKNWAGNYIWVHKQPWFLWQMAIAIKLFGCSELAIRIPSVIMSSLMVFIVYRMAAITVNKKTGWYAAFLCAVCFYQIEFVSGNVATDHNDIAFMFYVSCSFWAFLEYLHSGQKTQWMILVGIFAGISVLNKWLSGLVVFSGWFIYIISSRDTVVKLSNWRDLVTSSLIAITIMLPWQLYIFHAFPEEAAYEFNYNTQHFSQVIEGHEGTNWYHLDQIPFIYGKLAMFFVLPGILLFYKNSKRSYRIPFLTFLFVIYIFYTVAKTKMPLFTLCASSLMFVLFGSFMCECFEQLKNRQKKFYIPTWFVLVVTVGVIYMNTDELEKRHSVRWDKIQYARHKAGALGARRTGELLKEKDYIVFNADPYLLAEFCFYSGQRGHPGFPIGEEIRELKGKGVNIAVFYSPFLPDYIKFDKDIRILPKISPWIFE